MRVIYESERLLDNEGKLCLKTTAGNQTMKERIDDNLVYLNTTVKCKNRETKTLHGVNNTLSLEDVKDQEVRVTSLAKYNITYDCHRNNLYTGGKDRRRHDGYTLRDKP